MHVGSERSEDSIQQVVLFLDVLNEILLLLGKGVLKLTCALNVVLNVFRQDFNCDKAEILGL